MNWFHGIDGIFGNGQNFFDENGYLVGYSIDSVFGSGQNIRIDDGKRGYSVNSILGNGQSFYEDADPSDFFGNSDVDPDGNIFGEYINYSEGMEYHSYEV